MNARIRTAVVAGFLLAGWAGCSSILGLEEARLDANQAEAGPPPTLCEQYCEAVEKNCPDLTDEDGPNFSLYFSRAECLATCATFPEGNEGDEQVNTVHCRLRNARLALDLQDPETHCPIAGPGGNGECGTNCEGFCTMALAVCPATFAQVEADITAENCLTLCAELPDLGGFDIDKDLGNSVQCRLYHASAATLDDSTHCKHVANKINATRVGGPCDPSSVPAP